MLNMNVNSRNRKGEKPEDRFRWSDTDFRKQLRWLMKQEETVCMTITPKMAEIMLEYNDRNRPFRQAKALDYSRQMEEGKWVYTRVPIIFSDEGRLIDGQHRLAGVVESGTPIKVDVAFGAPDEAFSFIDIGKPRSAGDIFSIRGVANSALMAASMRWVLSYENGWITADKGRTQKRVTPDELYQAFCQHQKIADSAWVNHAMTASGARIIEPSIMVAFHYLCSKKDARLADSFFRKLAEGYGWRSKREPAFKLHQRLTRNLTEATKLPPRHKAAFVVKAWNRERQGRDMTAFTLLPDENFPEVR